MEFRGPPRMRGSQHRMPNRPGPPHPQQNPRMLNPSMPWGNNVNSYTGQEENSYQYQQGGMNAHIVEGFSQPYYPQNPVQTSPYPHSIQSPEILSHAGQGFPGYPPPHHFMQPAMFAAPIEPVFMNTMASPPMMPNTPPPPTINSGPPKKLQAFNSWDFLTTCSNCKHKNTLVGIELNKKDEEIRDLWEKNKALDAQVQRMEVELQSLREYIQKVTVNGAHQPVESSLSPEAIEFEPKREITQLNEVPVISIKGMSDEAVSDAQADSAEGLQAEIVEELPTETAEELHIEIAEKPSQLEPISSPLSLAKYEVPISASESDVKEESVEECWETEATLTNEPTSAIPEETKPLLQPEPVHVQPPSVVCSDWNENEMPQSSDHSMPQMPLSSDHSMPQSSRDTNNRTDEQQLRGDEHQWRVKTGKGQRRSRGSEPGHGNHSNYNQSYYREQKSSQEFSEKHSRFNNRSNERGQGYNKNQNFKNNTQRFNDERVQDGSLESTKDGSSEPRDMRNGPVREAARENRETSGRGWETQASETGKCRDDGGHLPGPERSNEDSTSHSGPFNHKRTSRNDDFNRPRDKRDRFHNNTGASGSNSRRPALKQIVKEVKGDLFTAPKDVSLGHCVARDFRMGSGIAVKFKSEFKRVPELLDQNVNVGGCAFLEDKENGRYIFYLVTKNISSGKPTYDNLRESLKDLKTKCQAFGVEKLAIPHIGCGLDHLDWYQVKNIINDTFQDTNMEITAYDFNAEGLPEGEGNKSGPSGVFVKYNIMNLVNIDRLTALLFLGTEDAHMDSTCMSLNSKFKFANDYKKASKIVGKVWCFESPDYYIYSLIVKKSFTDTFVFSHVDECCRELAKMLRRDRFNYVGIEYFQGWSENDTTFTEKIVTMLRNTLPRDIHEFWVCYPDEKLDCHDLCKKRVAKQPPHSQLQ